MNTINRIWRWVFPARKQPGMNESSIRLIAVHMANAAPWRR